MKRQKSLTWFTSFYGQLAVVFPFVVAAPRFFTGAIEVGGLMQIASAFGQVQGSLSFIVGSYSEIANWRAVIERLVTFRTEMEAFEEKEAQDQIVVAPAPSPALTVDGLDLALRVAVVSDEGPNELGAAADLILGGTAELVELLRRF